MGLTGGSRIDNMTVFLAVFLVIYGLLIAGVDATFYGGQFINPNSGISNEFDLGETYLYSAYDNVTPSELFSAYTEFGGSISPKRYLGWTRSIWGGGSFTLKCAGNDWWNGWLKYTLPPPSILEEEVLIRYDETKNHTRIKFDVGGDLETSVFFSPLLYYNETETDPQLKVTLIYTTLEESLDNDEITVIVATNSTYTNYNIGRVFSLLTGFSVTDIPLEINALVTGVFYAILILLLVKLVVG